MSVVWKKLQGVPLDDREYLISSEGAITVDGKKRAVTRLKNGYKRVFINGKNYWHHRIVAMTFLPNPKQYPEVNHIDNNPSNNNVSNLEWCTRSQNMRHAYLTGRLKISTDKWRHSWLGKKGRQNKDSIPVRAIFADGSTKDFESQNLASEAGFSQSKISDCIRGKRKTHGGARWERILEEEVA